MDHSKKFVLVPEKRLRQFTEDHLTGLDKEMHKTLRNPNLDDQEKSTLYLQILQKFTNFPLQQNKIESMQEAESMEPNIKEREDEFNQTNKDAERLSIESDVLDNTPVRKKKQAQKIMNFIQQNSNSLSRTNNKELTIKETILPNTNIVDLVTFLLKDRKTEPNGLQSFVDALKEIEFPSQLIKNKYLKYMTMYAKPINWIKYLRFLYSWYFI
ncbi:uncharacterized protein NPIL_24701 [Nephila pilipes]|uniref:Uncharacterized protein n=1 Tax=Nephila pilipes TaxID=299642 RepID=A0A8X6P1Y5_NEPPI|nr:uncharacterized protein NPIL_24701 [Nephila pilipes]